MGDIHEFLNSFINGQLAVWPALTLVLDLVQLAVWPAFDTCSRPCVALIRVNV